MSNGAPPAASPASAALGAHPFTVSARGQCMPYRSVGTLRPPWPAHTSASRATFNAERVATLAAPSMVGKMATVAQSCGVTRTERTKSHSQISWHEIYFMYAYNRI